MCSLQPPSACRVLLHGSMWCSLTATVHISGSLSAWNNGINVCCAGFALAVMCVCCFFFFPCELIRNHQRGACIAAFIILPGFVLLILPCYSYIHTEFLTSTCLSVPCTTSISVSTSSSPLMYASMRCMIFCLHLHTIIFDENTWHWCLTMLILWYTLIQTEVYFLSHVALEVSLNLSLCYDLRF